jgi:hypothetical protein
MKTSLLAADVGAPVAGAANEDFPSRISNAGVLDP